MTIAEQLDAIRAELAPLKRLESVINELLVARPSRAKQAKRAGVVPSTLWRREQKMKRQLLANGRL